MKQIPTFYYFLFLFILTSCTNTKNYTYFNNIGDAEINRAIEDLEPVIQKNDLLSITVSSPNPAATQILNPSSVASPQVPGYLVNQQGYIEFPMLGLVKAAGLSKRQLKDSLTKSIFQKQLLLDPIVTVRYINYKVTVLGEVAKPTVLVVTNEKISILEALGLAGDMTLYARRDNVLVIRDEEGKRVTKRLDLTSQNLLSSPYYYLKSNDILYVEPNKQLLAQTSNLRTWLPVVLSTLSFISVIIWRFVR
jgi:polysaccharide export outer membrane protein